MGRRRAALGPCLVVGLIAFGAACGKERPVAQAERPECTLCHGQPPETGAHVNHTTPSALYGKSFLCNQCHFTPQRLNDPGHLLDAQGRPIPVFTGVPGEAALVRFDQEGSLANVGDPDDRARVGPAKFDPSTMTCSAVYCHGGTFDFDTRATNRAPTWAPNQPKPAPCGSCHGIPPANHIAPGAPPILQTQCVNCHVGAIDAFGRPNPPTHIDGTVEVAPGAVLPTGSSALLGPASESPAGTTGANANGGVN